MVTGKLISSLKVAVFSILLFASGQAAADYMVDYGPGPVACTSCYQPCNRCKREYYHRAHRARHYYPHYARQVRRHGSYRFEILYTTTPYPDFYYDSCGYYGCHPVRYFRQSCNVQRYAISPVREINTCQGCQICNQGISYDRSTADDTTDYY
jgi:hypothetical protein